MSSICGADCSNCENGKNGVCKGCSETQGCPFGKQCFIAKYILVGGKEKFEIFKRNQGNPFTNLKRMLKYI